MTLVVPDYDAAIAYYVARLGFQLVEDTRLTETKRWVRVRPPGQGATCLSLARAETENQKSAIGNQTGGRVFLFLQTDDFARDHARYRQAGVRFLEEPRVEVFGTVAVFEDPFGNKWDLIEPGAVSDQRGTDPAK